MNEELSNAVNIQQLRKDIQSDITKRVTKSVIFAILGVITLAAVGAWLLLIPVLQKQLDIVTHSELTDILSKSSNGALPLKGAILIYSREVSCPKGSIRIANLNIQSRRDDPNHAKTRALAVATSEYNGGNNWDGNSYPACYYQ